MEKRHVVLARTALDRNSLNGLFDARDHYRKAANHAQKQTKKLEIPTVREYLKVANELDDLIRNSLRGHNGDLTNPS